MRKQKLLIFASGTETNGGSGFAKIVDNVIKSNLSARILAVISNHKNGGIYDKAHSFSIPFEYFPGPWKKEDYQGLIRKYCPDYTILSGWSKLTEGLDPRKTVNVHPAPLPMFGGFGMYGIHVHQAVLDAYHAGKVKQSAVSMHFVTNEYDQGPVFFEMPVPINNNDTVKDLEARVKYFEHEWVSYILNMVMHGHISWDGRNPKSLAVPQSYPHLPKGQ